MWGGFVEVVVGEFLEKIGCGFLGWLGYKWDGCDCGVCLLLLFGLLGWFLLLVFFGGGGLLFLVLGIVLNLLKKFELSLKFL